MEKATDIRDALVQYFQNSIKTHGEKYIGVEVEHFIIESAGGKPVSYYGEAGIESILREHTRFIEADLFSENGHLLGFAAKDHTITLEPAGQYEISISPCKDIHGIQEVYQSFLHTITPLLKRHGYVLCSTGYLPEAGCGKTGMIPKERYRLMERYFREIGTDGSEMMFCTASTQISVDYFSENDFRRKLQVAYLLTPLFELLSSNIYRSETSSDVRYLKRAAVWRNTDPARCGIPGQIFSGNYGFGDYAEYLCRTPLILE